MPMLAEQPQPQYVLFKPIKKNDYENEETYITTPARCMATDRYGKGYPRDENSA